MPIYEYQCLSCRRRVSFFLRTSHDQLAEPCPHCGGQELRRIMSRFAAPKSEEARMESLADPSKWSGLDENDPNSVAKFMKKMGKEMGEDLGEDFDQAVDDAAHEAETGAAASDSTGGELD